MKKAVLITLLLISQSFAQIGKWENYTDMKNVRKINPTDNAIFAGTEGGIFIFYPESNQFEKILKVDGLFDVDVRVLTTDKNHIFVGFQNGVIDILTQLGQSYKINRVFDIVNSPETDKGINFLKVYGDTLFIGTNFGLLTYRISKLEFIDTYRKIFPDVERVQVFDLEIVGDTIYVATSEGIAKGNRFNPALVSPLGWNVWRKVGGFKSISVLKGEIYTGAQDGMFRLQGESFVKVFSSPVDKILNVGDSILIVSGKSIYSFKNGNVNFISEAKDIINDVSIWRGKIIAGVRSSGVGILENGQWSFHYPEGPNGSQFSSMAVDNKGNLWVASSKFLGKGFYKFDGKKWKNFSKETFPNMSNDCYRVRIGKKYIWIGTWGGGLIRVDENDSLKIFSKQDGFMGVVEDTNFVVITDIAEQGDYTWILNYKARNLIILYLMRNDSLLASFRNGFKPSDFYNIQIELDEKGKKWIVTEHGYILVFDDNGTLLDKSDDKWFNISTAHGLNGNPTVIRFDNRGDLWVGTAMDLT
jgi:ligand-binding sensor domain-containing protein